ncbi:hypothetical protein [Paenibacillus sp. DYY-L-2]|uniref:hypothetical protein n=1 Tax=Paenibacillus sp. DYY-L-2 TaxID=3447013 RepID=UPI003F504DDD
MPIIKNKLPKDQIYPEPFDSLFEEAFQQAIDSLPAPSESDRRKSWEQIQKKLDRKRARTRRRHRWQISGIVAASMILGAMLFSPPVVTKAVPPFFQELINLGSGMSQMVFDTRQPSSGAKTPPPPDGFTEDELREMKKEVHLVDAGVYNTVEMDIDQAREVLAFSLPRITYIPERFTLSSLEVIIPSGTPEDPNTFGKSAHLLYKSDEEEMLRLIFDLLMDDSVLSTMSRSHTEEVQLENGNTAYVSTGDMTQINMMLSGNVFFHAFGNVSKEEMVDIVNGFNH